MEEAVVEVTSAEVIAAVATKISFPTPLVSAALLPATVFAPNMALNPVRFALWTLRDKAAQRRLALR